MAKKAKGEPNNQSFWKRCQISIFFSAISLVLSILIILVMLLGMPTFMKLVHGVLNFGGGGESQRAVAAEQIFKDVPVDSPLYEITAELKKNNVIQGYSDGTLKVNEPLKRAELLKLILAYQHRAPLAIHYANCYPDVKTDWYAPYVCYAKSRQWIEGDTGKDFYPLSPVTKA
ncbi:MAG: S-layer homology domain-containing protein, partial [Phycisphaeraceae bacterium]|nr:S-layer homology domain-containing protein [Phycisphaeraceae bacterium]